MSDASPVGKDSNFSRLLGIRILRAENGEAELRMAMQEQMLNLHGRMHGGALYSLIDTALGQASHSLFGVEAGEVVCHARVLNAGRKVHVLEARVEQGDKLIATAQATFICK